MIGYELHPLSQKDVGRWDELIARCAGREVFHRRAWLDYLAASRGVDVRFWSIQDHGRIVGYFCGGIVHHGPFCVLGSPLRGWGTNFMGPVVLEDFCTRKFIRALDELARQENLAMSELESWVLDAEELVNAGYEPLDSSTYLVRLRRDREAMFAALESNARTHIRAAIRAGLAVEDTDDPVVADEYYDQFCEVVSHKHAATPFPRAHPQLLVRHLKKADLLFSLRVRNSQGRLVATGLFPHDDVSIYSWGTASCVSASRAHSNDFRNWMAMCLAAERGLEIYNTCSYGRFKSKFGGTLIETRRWHKFHWASARWARRGYELFWNGRRWLLSRRSAALRETHTDTQRNQLLPS